MVDPRLIFKNRASSTTLMVISGSVGSMMTDTSASLSNNGAGGIEFL